LRDGKNKKYAKHLNSALDKLPNHKGMVYRGTKLSKSQLEKYKQSLKNATTITEKPFTSTSTSISTANQYSKANTIFTIFSQTGKKIEDYTYYGKTHPQNEKEVLFKSNTTFKVLHIDESDSTTKIFLEEIPSSNE